MRGWVGPRCKGTVTIDLEHERSEDEIDEMVRDGWIDQPVCDECVLTTRATLKAIYLTDGPILFVGESQRSTLDST